MKNIKLFRHVGFYKSFDCSTTFSDDHAVQVIGIMPNEIIGQQIPLIYQYLPGEIARLTVDLSFINTSIGFGSVAIVGILTVLSQTIRAGHIEPIKILKVE